MLHMNEITVGIGGAAGDGIDKSSETLAKAGIEVAYLGWRDVPLNLEVKLEVWARDRGKCVICGATDELHFDHDLPYSKGGTSLTASNVQLLCARHNLSKGSKIL